MLQAFMHSKRKLHYFDKVNPFVEDTLTSSIFGLLRYLPDALLDDIWREVLTGIEPRVSLGSLKKCVFWPRWRLPVEGTWCEPDVFCQFEHGNVIIEAKRNDDEELQYHAQWGNELSAYRYYTGFNESIPLFLLAIGGLGGRPLASWVEESGNLADDFSCVFIFVPWAELWRKCIKPVLRQAMSEGQDRAIQTLYHDLQSTFRLFGIATEPPKFMNTFPRVTVQQPYRFCEALVPLSARLLSPVRFSRPKMDSFPQAAQLLRLSPVPWSSL